jgi:hypothetical protein
MTILVGTPCVARVISYEPAIQKWVLLIDILSNMLMNQTMRETVPPARGGMQGHAEGMHACPRHACASPRHALMCMPLHAHPAPPGLARQACMCMPRHACMPPAWHPPRPACHPPFRGMHSMPRRHAGMPLHAPPACPLQALQAYCMDLHAHLHAPGMHACLLHGPACPASCPQKGRTPTPLTCMPPACPCMPCMAPAWTCMPKPTLPLSPPIPWRLCPKVPLPSPSPPDPTTPRTFRQPPQIPP